MAEIIQGMTNNGLRLLGLSQEKTVIEFTKFKVGDGFITDENLSELNDLVNVIDEIPIESTDVLEDNGQVSMVFNGKVHQIKEDFYFRELGLYAIDPETNKEVLYAYLNKGEDAALIPMISNQAAVQEAVSMIVTIGNAANVVVNYKDNSGLLNSGHNMFDIVMKDHILDDEEKRGLAEFGEYVYKKTTKDHPGYPEFYKKCLEEYNNATDKTIRTTRNYNVEGAPIIYEDYDNNNVSFTGFSKNDYITISSLKEFEKENSIEFTFNTGHERLLPVEQCILSAKNSDKKYGLYIGIKSKKLILYVSNNGTKWNIVSGKSCATTLLPDTEYTVKLNWISGQLIFSIINDDNIDKIELTYASTNPNLPFTNYYIGINANNDTFNSPFLGTIKLIDNSNYVSKIHSNSNFYNTIKIKEAENKHRYYDISAVSDEIEYLYNTNGMAWFYGIDIENECIRIPRNDWYFMNSTSTDVGMSKKAGLPNITGNFGGAESNNQASYGAFFTNRGNTTDGGSSSKDADVTFFDANRCSILYGSSDTVQTNAVKLIPYMVVGRISSFGVVGGTIILDDFITNLELETRLSGFGTKEELAAKQAIGDYALKSEIPDISTKADLSSVYTKSEIETKIDGIIRIKGSVDRVLDLPSDNIIIGDTYRVLDTCTNYVWMGDEWNKLGGDINLNDYVTIPDLDVRLDNKADASTTLEGYGISDAYTKEEIDAKVASIYRVKGSVENYASLPNSTNVDEDEEYIELTIGDVYNVLDTGANYVWTENGWDKLSETLDLSNLIDASKKVIDGQWVHKREVFLDGTGTGTYSLSSYLPNDSYNYEVLFDYLCQASASAGQHIYIASDIMTDSMEIAFLSTSTTTTSSGIFRLPVGTDRSVSISGSGTKHIRLNGYRRIGTNS